MELLVIAAVVWAVGATAVASGRRRDCDCATHRDELRAISAELDRMHTRASIAERRIDVLHMRVDRYRMDLRRLEARSNGDDT